MSEKLHDVPGVMGAASNVKMVNQLLAGVHVAAAAEAMGLAVRMGLNTRTVYQIITNAAGNSYMFENRVPHMLENDWTPQSALSVFIKNMVNILTVQHRAKYNSGYGPEDDSGLVRLYLSGSGSGVHDLAKIEGNASPTSAAKPTDIQRIGFVGLGAMGQGMATSLVTAGFAVSGYNVYAPSIQRFLAGRGKSYAAASPAEAARDAQVLVLMVQNAAQAEDVLFGSGKAAENLPKGSIVILNSTVPPSFVIGLRKRLVGMETGIELVDAPVSGGVSRAAQGQLTVSRKSTYVSNALLTRLGQIIASATDAAMAQANPVLAAMSGVPKNLYYIEGEVGTASSVKLINQLLAGVHIVAAAEAMAFGSKLGVDTRALYETIKIAAGGSWMFENRVPAMLNADWTPHSSLAIFVKDLAILDESKQLLYPATLSAAAHQLYLLAASHGWTHEADSGVPEPLKPREYPKLPVHETLASLPEPYQEDVLGLVRERIESDTTPLLVVLDDDPTGTQTCDNVMVLTTWDHAILCSELSTTKKGFFILTNSRALPPTEARKLVSTICSNLTAAAKETGKDFEIVLRGDSTLRGHFPDEPEAVEEVLGKADNWVLTPFFLQGGRYTINDVHYVAEQGVLVPASQTPFAEDAAFGYRSSNLRDYVLEKAGTRFTASDVCSITLEDIRIGGPAKVTERLLLVPAGNVIVVNAAAESDMFVFAAGALAAEQAGKKYLYRTGAAFVSCRLGITSIPPMSAKDLNMDYGPKSTGGLIIAGSYVPKTTAQLASLRSRRGDRLHVVELDVANLIRSPSDATTAVESAIADANDCLSAGTDVLIMTSRTLVKGTDARSSLQMGSAIGEAL
ncbi:hypothetical protein B0A49_00560, partial [Cryomyces minteri]